MTALAVSPLLAFAAAAASAFFLARTRAPFLPEDTPNARSLHTRATPRSGGLAVLIGLAAAAASWGELPRGSAAWAAAATALVAITSFADDRKELPPAIRLALHSAAAAAVVWGAGLSVPEVWLPGFGATGTGRAAGVLSFLGLLWMTNLYNFMDGMDGFAGSMTAIGGSFLGLALLEHDAPGPARLSFALAGAAAGFLTQNWPPARLFLGDVGAVTIGFVVGILTLAGASRGRLDPAVPLLVFAPFVLDATLTLAGRVARGARVWEAHRMHGYQRLVLAGWGHRRTLLLEIVLMLLSGSAALAWADATADGRAVILAAVAASAVVLHAGVRRAERAAARRPA
ncbi:MAG: glycosyl transferase [Acidobacteria bacterium]|nr:glycosyl transferase [Acidobacteriota bacterium]